MKLILITGNENKLKEIKNILGNNIDIINHKIDLPEIQSINVKDVINYKIDEAYNQASKIYGNDIAVICEDTGLHIENMYEFPGALIKFYFESVGNHGIVNFNGGSFARVITIIGLKNKNGKYIFEGVADGRILNDSSKIIQNKNVFGWDPIFIPRLTSDYKQYFYKSYAEIPSNVKNRISARFNALMKLKEFLLKPINKSLYKNTIIKNTIIKNYITKNNNKNNTNKNNINKNNNNLELY